MGPEFSGTRWGTTPMLFFASGVVSHYASKNGSSQLCQAGRRRVAFPTEEEEAESCFNLPFTFILKELACPGRSW